MLMIFWTFCHNYLNGCDNVNDNENDHQPRAGLWVTTPLLSRSLRVRTSVDDDGYGNGERHDDVLTLLEGIPPSLSWLPHHKLQSMVPNLQCSRSLILPDVDDHDDHDDDEQWRHTCAVSCMSNRGSWWWQSSPRQTSSYHGDADHHDHIDIICMIMMMLIIIIITTSLVWSWWA